MDMISFVIARRLVDRFGQPDLADVPEAEPAGRRARVAAQVAVAAATLAAFVALMSAGAPAHPAAVAQAWLAP